MGGSSHVSETISFVCSAMASVAFDDIAKSVTDILNEDHVTSGCQFKTKQKTQFSDASWEAIVDVGGKENVGKMKLKLLKPFGFSNFSINKLEFDKSGDIKTEATSKVADGVSLQLKTELMELSDVKNFKNNKGTSAGVTYTGLPDTVVKVETKLTDPAQFKAELMKTIKNTKVGVKCEGVQVPDAGVSHTDGPLHVVLTAKQMTDLTLFGSYAVDKDTSFATSCKLRGSDSGSVSVGFQHQINAGWALKAKMQTDNSLSASLKHSNGGCTFLTGARFAPNSAQPGWGLGFQCIVE